MPKTKDNKRKTKHDKPKNEPPVCVLCKSGEDDELRFGKFFKSKELAVHNFCMLFSSDLSQNGKNDNDGFAGFLIKDIKREVIRGKRLKCSYCKKNGSTIGCCVPICKKVFHLNCGQKHKSFHLFYDSFLSYCCVHKSHPIYPEGELLTNEYTCSICCETVYLSDRDTTVWTSCCKNGWFHKPCIQRQANNAGYFFRCPLCNNTEQFQKQMLIHGIYIPQQDAAWELEENAFQDLLFRHEQCDASVCLCPKGRKHHTKTSQWRLILCEDCGSQGRHIGCEDSITPKGSWKCQFCMGITEKMKAKKESECSKNAAEKKTDCNRQKLRKRNNGRVLRRSVRDASAENNFSFKGEIHLASEEPPLIKDECPLASEQKSDGANCTALHGGAMSLNTESSYKITKISKRGKEDLPKFIGNSEVLDIQSETKESLYINIEDKECREGPAVEHENAIDLFSDVVASISESDSDSSPYKCEIFPRGNTNGLSELPSSTLSWHSLNEGKEVSDLSVANSSTSHILFDNRSVILVSKASKIPSVKNEFNVLQGDSSLSEAGDGDVSGVTSMGVNCESFLPQNITPVDLLCKENTDMKQISTVEDTSSNFSFSPDTLKKTYKMDRKHSKRISPDVEEKLLKKQKINDHSEQVCNSVRKLNLVQDVKQNIDIEDKHSVKPCNRIQAPTLSAGPAVCYSQNTDNEEQSNETLDTKNILGNSNTPSVMKSHGSVECNIERDHREPFVKLIAVPNRLAKKTVRIGRAEGDCAVSRSSNKHLTSENRSVKKQKLNGLPKKNYGSTLRCTDNYRCIKALFGGPCKCCEDRVKLMKESSTKSKSKKCSQNCRPQYNIECFGKRSEEVSLASKHSCNRPTNYVVNFWHSAKQISTVTETKEKLSVKPQVIHLKTVPH